MKSVIIDKDKCKNCPTCEIDIFCPFKAVYRESNIDKPWIDFYKCSGCQNCINKCPYRALKINN